MGDLFTSIRFGDRVSIANRFGQTRTGRATIFNRGANLWVLNMGGPHGSPGIATPQNVVKVRKTKHSRSNDRRFLINGRNLYEAAVTAEHEKLKGA